MRVAAVNQDPGIDPGRAKGAAVHLRAMRAAMAAQGARVIAVDESREDRLLERLHEVWDEASIDLVYERYALARPAGARFAAERGIPFVLEVNAPLAEEARRWRGRVESAADRELDRLVFSRARRVIAVSRPVAEYARARGARAEAVEVVPNGVDAGRFRPRRSGDRRRAELVPAGRFALGFHGRLRPWHGFERLAEATARLLARGVPVHLVVVGEGDFERHLAGRVPVDRRTLVGWTPHREVGRSVAAFDALPLTYGQESPCYFSPLKLAEAMACGVVPIVPRLGDLHRLVRDGVDGKVYPAGDLERLVAAIEWLYLHPERRRELAEQALVSARRRSWERIAARVLSCAGAEEPGR